MLDVTNSTDGHPADAADCAAAGQRDVASCIPCRFVSLLAVLLLAGVGVGTWFVTASGWPKSQDSTGERVAHQQSTSQPANSTAFDLSNALIPREEIRHGGPAKDGIPSLTNPKVIKASEATYLKPDDRVIGIVIQEEARAYPLKILNWHEAVNDRVGNAAVAVTYCPLCDSAAVFDRKDPSGELELGISGLLYNSNVLLYDRRKNRPESLWSQMMNRSVAGPSAGQALASLPCELTTWQDWTHRHPTTDVLSLDTGYPRAYSASPYTMYFQHQRLMFPVKPVDKRIPLKTRVLGVWTSGKARAYPISAFNEMQAGQRLEQRIGGLTFELAYSPDAKSVRIVKADSGIHWMYAFWFAWYAFHPETELFGGTAS